MATLEKIRSKSVLLVSIIFVALFLFIITIIDNPIDLIADRTTVLKVKGEKISYELLQDRSSQMREQMAQYEQQTGQKQNIDDDQLTAQVLQQLVNETLLKQEYDALGITVTNKELSSAILGEQANPMVVNYFTQQYGVAPADFYKAFTQPSEDMPAETAAQLQAEWQKFEENVDDFLRQQKFQNMLAGAIHANKYDARAAYDRSNTTYDLLSVSVPLSQCTDTVTPAELNTYYKQHRERYKLPEETRFVRYINLNVAASSADRASAIAQADSVMIALANEPEMDGVNAYPLFSVKRENLTAEKITAGYGRSQAAFARALVDSIKGMQPGQVKKVYNTANNFADPQIVIAKLMGRETRVNSATLQQVRIDPTFNADSIVAQLNGGADPAAMKGLLDKQLSPSRIEYSEAVKEPWDKLREAGAGKYVLLQGGDGSQLAVKVVEFAEPEEVFDYATATINITPSNNTISELQKTLSDFLSSVNGAENFTNETLATFLTKNADQYAPEALRQLSVAETFVSKSSPSLDRLSQSRSVVAWAMSAKKGAVSGILSDNTQSRFTAVALVDVIKDDYLPLAYVEKADPSFAYGALQEKQGRVLCEQYAGKGKTIAEYAAAMKSQIDTIKAANPGLDARFAALRGHKQHDLVGPVRSDYVVRVSEVLAVNKSTMPYDEKSSLLQVTNQQQQRVAADMTTLLLGRNKIDNRILKFTNAQ
jgi:peptidyl-prolyl cis-trans isomerase D